MYNTILLVLSLISFSQCDSWDFIYGVDTNFQQVPESFRVCYELSSCHKHIQDLLANKFGIVTYAAIKLNYNSCLCSNINNTLSATMIVVGAGNINLPIKGTANVCSSFSECLKLGCGVRHPNATGFLLTGRS